MCYAHLGQADNAVSHLKRSLVDASGHLLIGSVPAANVEAARAYTVVGEPEAACAYAVEALDGARETGYRAGVARVAQVRGRMPGDWAPLGCVQDLDERLRLVAWS